MTDALPEQLRALAALVERVEATAGAGVEVQAAQPAGVDPDGDLLRAELTVIVPTDGLSAPAADVSPADAAERGDDGSEGDADAGAEESEDASLAELTDTVRGDVLAVVKHGQSVESRADDRDVTTHAINHNLRVAREELNVNDLKLVVAPTESEREAAEGQEEAPEWAMADGGAAAAQTAARVECQGCGATVSRDYARVFSPDDVDGVRTCPDCPDLIREGDGTVRKKRSGPHAVSSEEVQDGDE